ncbi:DUF7562 family protein [Halobacterium zhouii]|uniref:DUF7562 family protein n=1 Tax=Halobacterium zhouii TaxID=2902624 RepID=UPI001E543324|nr:hypothetical protein [Halobacterium zhouii]
MLGSRNQTVSCIACGTDLERADAREYDKYGDRWDRDGKEFEHLCKPCFRGLNKYARDGLEDTLVELDAGRVSDAEFIEQFIERTHEEHAGRE